MPKSKPSVSVPDEPHPVESPVEVSAETVVEAAAVEVAEPEKSDEVPFVPPVVNPTSTKPTLEFEVTGHSGLTIRGFFVDESAALAHFADTHGQSSTYRPTIKCLTEPRIAVVR